ncbi:MAG: transcriptional repressor LexA [Candidatus Hydrogenedentes bacterium]|nr:transcriptional repressor LexA [Candidatus Hydrogenedentota bacterium]MBI3118698.1 transcriptional repressor LexA [Candidatus Hydrogenedentota bacterium]
MARDLTKRQRAILEYLIACIRDHGLPPTIAEIGARFKISSTNGVNDHLLALEKKGFIERSSKARGIRITPKAAIGLYQRERPVTLPLVGRVAAGYPLLAEQNIESQVHVGPRLARPNSYCLRVAGDSMIEAGILEGDVVIVDAGRRPKKGDVVVALVEDEATVKYFHPDGPEVELRPANSTMAPMRYPAGSVLVQGVVVGLQRVFN